MESGNNIKVIDNKKVIDEFVINELEGRKLDEVPYEELKSFLSELIQENGYVRVQGTYARKDMSGHWFHPTFEEHRNNHKSLGDIAKLVTLGWEVGVSQGDIGFSFPEDTFREGDTLRYGAHIWKKQEGIGPTHFVVELSNEFYKDITPLDQFKEEAGGLGRVMNVTKIVCADSYREEFRNYGQF